MPMFNAPGVFDIPEAEYHSVITPQPALTSSVAKLLAHNCPARAWFESEANPDREREENKKFDLGTAAHLAVLQPGLLATRIARVTGYDDWKKKDAQSLRDAAYLAGKTPLLDKDVERVDGIRDAITRHPECNKLFRHGEPERTIIWRDEEFGVWKKARPDWWADDLADIKTVPSCDSDSLERVIWQHHWYQQSAHYLEGAKAVGRAADEFLFVAIENKAPHLIVCAPLDAKAIEWGAMLNRHATAQWARCLKEDRWPGYRPGTLGLPSWAHYRLEQRMEFGRYSVAELARNTITEGQRRSADRFNRRLDQDEGEPVE